MVKKTKLFAQLPKFGCLLGNNSASLKISGILPQKQASFETGGRTYFTLQGDRFVTYVSKIGSGASRAIFYLQISQSRLDLFSALIDLGTRAS